MGSFFTLICLVVHDFYPYIGINLLMNTLSFLPYTANSMRTVYGENIDMSQILPSSQHYVVNSKGQDLIDIAATLGINLIRITNAKRSFDNSADSIYTKDQWDQVLNKMQRKGIKALILIETASNNKAYYDQNIQNIYLHLVNEYIDSGVFANPDVYAVDIKNEPILTDANVSILQTAHDMIKAKYPALKETVGWWGSMKQPADSYEHNDYNWSDFSAGQKLANIVDFFSVHMYGLDTNRFGINISPALKTKLFLSQVETGLQTKKPILIEEFGEANGDAVSDQDTIGNPQLQANIYQGVYQALSEMHSGQIIGSVAFDFYSRDQYHDAWAVIKNNGNYLFPAAYVIQEYALRKNNPTLEAATVVHSQSYLLENADNYRTENFQRYDRVGLKLQLDSRNSYSLSLSAHGILQPIEPLHYNPNSDSYEAVYWAPGRGSVELNIIQKTNFAVYVPDRTRVYTVMITIV